MTKNKIGVVLNAPPQSGKDTIAKIICDRTDFVKHQFKDALYEHTARHFAVDLDKFIHYASDGALKDTVSLAGLGGRTPRQALIHVSEDIYKPRFGNDYFGKVEASNLRELSGRMGGAFNVIYPDGGFPTEIPPIESELDALLIIRLHRIGFDFSNDSRNYIYLPDTAKRLSIDLSLYEGQIQEGVDLVLSNIELFKVI